jgi:hypothetical protein
MKIRPMGVELFHADGKTAEIQTDRRRGGWTDMTELIVSFRNFANSPKNSVPASQRNCACPKYTLFFVLYREIITNDAILLRGDRNYFRVDSLAFHKI